MRWIRLLGLFAVILSLLLPAGRGAWAAPAARRWLAEPMLLFQGETAAGIDLDAVDASHVWAIAGRSILFFDGESWSVQFSADEALSAIEMSGPTRGWALGSTTQPGAKFYAFDGAGWNIAPSPDSIVSRIAAAGDGTLLAVGWNGISGSNGRSDLEYFDGSQWHTLLPYNRASVSMQVAGDGSTWIWGNSVDGISIYDAPHPFVLRYANGALTSVNVPSSGPSGPEVSNREGLTSVQMISASEGWASLSLVSGERKVYHYIGGTWNETSLPTPPERAGASYQALRFLAGNSSEVIAIASWDSLYGPCGATTLLRYAGGAWSIVGSLPAWASGALLPASNAGWISTYACEATPAQRFRYAAGTLTADSAGSDLVPTQYDLAGADAQWAVGPGMIMRYTDAASPTAPAAAQPGARYFAETGHNLSGAFRTFYERNGLDFGEPGVSAGESLALFGYPLTEPFSELNPDTGEYLLVQYFERVRMEYHPANPDPYKVLLGRLGAVRYIQANGSIRPGNPETPLGAGCERIAPTNHDLCPPFRDYWHSVGSVQIFGLPIANAASEVSYTDGATYLTLWTERERLEHHPELAGTRYEILLGLLAKEDLRMRGYLE